MRSVILSRGFSKKTLFLCFSEVLLLAGSAEGFWLWAQLPLDQYNFVHGRVQSISYFCIGSLCLILAVYLALRSAAAVGLALGATGYQLRIDQLQKRLNEQDDFFHSITDSTPSSLTIYDEANAYWYLNASAGRLLGVSSNDILGMKPVSVAGPERGRKIEKCLDQVRQSGKALETLAEVKIHTGEIRYIKTDYQLLTQLHGVSGAVMARDEDVTTILVERERRENMLRQVISTLSAVVDRRDPYASGHSARTGQLARALATELRLNVRECEAAEIAGSLMNFGKVLVSRSILTKTGALTPDELQRIRDGILTSADILSLIDFGMPVVATLRQVLERYDGTGVPVHLKGDDILITARIVTLANAFVAMVSPRAYRPGIEMTIAAQNLSEDAGKIYDPRVLAALNSYLTRNAAKLSWLTVAKPVV